MIGSTRRRIKKKRKIIIKDNMSNLIYELYLNLKIDEELKTKYNHILTKYKREKDKNLRENDE